MGIDRRMISSQLSLVRLTIFLRLSQVNVNYRNCCYAQQECLILKGAGNLGQFYSLATQEASDLLHKSLFLLTSA